MANITKRDIVEILAEKTGFTQSDTKLVVESLMNSIAESLQKGDNIEIRGFGRFKVKQVKAHSARNPRTSEMVEVEDGYKPIFEASTQLRDRVSDAIISRK